MTEGALRVPFLRQLAPEEASDLVRRCRRRTIARSELVLRAGSPGDEVVLVLSGRVQLTARGAEDRELTLAIRGPGELLGEMAAFGAGRRTASVVALEEVEAGFLSMAEFREFLLEHPDTAIVLIRMLVGRLAEADRDRVALATQDSIGRVARRLLALAADHGTRSPEGTIELAITQDELARWTGATRETVSRALRLMRQLGWVATEQGAIHVLDADALRERGSSGG